MNYIYCFTNLINGKKYIGSTIKKPNERYNQHLYNARHKNNPKYNYPLYCAIRKYGENNFQFEVIREVDCNELELRKIEQDYISLFNCLSPNGYNQTLNTEHPLMDEHTIKKVSETKREKAKRVVEVDKDNNIINSWRSIIDCAENENLLEKNIAACCRGEQITVHGRKFYWIDDNNNLIIPVHTSKNSYKGAPGTTQIQSSSRKVLKLDDEDNIIDIYDTIALAARENNCDSSAISKVCRKLRKKCGGYRWKYDE